MDTKDIAYQISKQISNCNVISLTNCMTRLRFSLKSSNVNINKIKTIPGVLGVIQNLNNLQIILQPQIINQVCLQLKKIYEISVDDVQKIDVSSVKNKFRLKGQFTNFLSKVSQIFSPLLPLFIASGFCQAIGSIILISYGGEIKNVDQIAKTWISFFTLAFSLTIQIMPIIVGYQTAKVYGGNAIIGALLGAIYCPLFGQMIGNLYYGDLTILNGRGGYFLGIQVSNIEYNWLTVGIFSKKDNTYVASGLNGSIFGALLISLISAKLEIKIKKFITEKYYLFLVPFSILLISIILNFVFIIPISGYLFLSLSYLFNLIIKHPYLFVLIATLLAGIWLWAVVLGIHQGATPIYLFLIKNYGLNILFPILALAGASQVGSSIALYFRSKKSSNIRKQILTTLPIAFLGIGEPLIYSITLPRIKPFITASVGAGLAAILVSCLLFFDIQLGTSALGPSGLLALPLITIKGSPLWTGYVFYLLSLLLAYVFGFVITYFFGYKGVDLT